MARFIVEVSGGHLEACVRELLDTRRSKSSFGTFEGKRGLARMKLVSELSDAIQRFCELWNDGRHDFGIGSGDSVIPFD